MEKEKKKKIKTILYVTLIVLLIAGNVYVYVKNHIKPKEKTVENQVANEVNETYEFSSDEEIENIMKQKVSTMGERSRMQTYIGEFLGYITQGRYDKAYGYLNDSFKENYFKTEDDFKAHVVKNFPVVIATEYDDIERRGEYYILTVKLFDAMNSNFETITRRFVIKEYGKNDFKLSFQTEEDKVEENNTTTLEDLLGENE